MSLHQTVKTQIVEAMKARDTVRLNVLRGLSTAFTNENVSKKRDPQTELTDEESQAVISRAVKQRKDSIEQFEKGGRADLVEGEKAELSILEAYLPQQMSREEIEVFVKSKPLPSPEGKNQFMGSIMKELKGRADGNVVKEVVDSLLI